MRLSYRDLMIRNDTQTTFRLHVTVGGEFSQGSGAPTGGRNTSTRGRTDHCMQSEYWGGYSRHNKLYREVHTTPKARCVDVQYVTRNDALMMYSPFAENAQPGKTAGRQSAARL